MATKTFGAPYQHSVLQREELTGLAALFASNLDGVPEAVRKEKATRAAVLRQERLSLESAARRRAEIAGHLSQARVMGLERRVAELKAEAAARAERARETACPSGASSGTRAQLESARKRFEEFVREAGPRATSERHAASAQLVDELRRERMAVEARRSASQAEFLEGLKLQAAIEEERERLQQAYQVEEDDRSKLRELVAQHKERRQYYAPLQVATTELGMDAEEVAGGTSGVALGAGLGQSTIGAATAPAPAPAPAVAAAGSVSLEVCLALHPTPTRYSCARRHARTHSSRRHDATHACNHARDSMCVIQWPLRPLSQARAAQLLNVPSREALNHGAGAPPPPLAPSHTSSTVGDRASRPGSRQASPSRASPGRGAGYSTSYYTRQSGGGEGDSATVHVEQVGQLFLLFGPVPPNTCPHTAPNISLSLTSSVSTSPLLPPRTAPSLLAPPLLAPLLANLCPLPMCAHPLPAGGRRV